MWRDFDRVGIMVLDPLVWFASSSIALGLDLLKFSHELFQITPEVRNVSGSCSEHHCRKEADGFRKKMMQGGRFQGQEIA